MPKEDFNLPGALENARNKLSSLQPKLPLQFRFSWEGVQFSAQVDSTGNDSPATLRLCGDLCPLPFSGENKAKRQKLLELDSYRNNAEQVRFSISGKKRFLILGEASLAAGGAVNGIDVIQAIVSLLLRLRPYFQVLRNRLA